MQSLPCAEETGVEHLVGNERRFCNSLISSDLTFEPPSQQDQLKKQMWRHRSQSCVRYKLLGSTPMSRGKWDTRFNGCGLIKAWLFSNRKSSESLDILIPVVNVNPESHLQPTGHSFSLKIPREVVSNILLKIDEKKATMQSWRIWFRVNCWKWLLTLTQKYG